MDKRILAIFDREENYAFRLMDFMNGTEKLPFEIHAFTNETKFFAYTEKEEIECLLISESAYQERIEQLKIPHIIILTESGNNIHKSYCHIGKYQSCDKILREIMHYYSESAQSDNPTFRTANQRMKIIGIYTPVGRCLQTTFSLTLGQMLARNYKTLYLNFETYSGLGRMLNREFQSDLADLAYYFNCAKEKLFYRMESMIETVNGLDYIPPVTVFQNLSGINGTQWIDLFKEIERISNYEFLVLDLTDGIMDLWEVLRNCDFVYTIVREDALALAKIEQYEKALKNMNYEDVSEKTHKCNLPIFRQLPICFEELTYGELSTYIKKRIFPELFKGNERFTRENNWKNESEQTDE